MRAFGEESINRVKEYLELHLNDAEKQPADSHRLSSYSNVTEFGVAKRLADNDMHSHSGNQVFR